MKKKTILIVTSILICITAIVCWLFTPSKVAYTPQQNLNAPIEIPAEGIVTIQEANESQKPQVIMFYVDWCGYCRRFMPKFGEFAKKYADKYTFTVVNCDNPENKQMVDDFHIMGFPVLFVVDNEVGHKFSLHMGATVDKEIMEEELENYLKVREKFLK